MEMNTESNIRDYIGVVIVTHSSILNLRSVCLVACRVRGPRLSRRFGFRVLGLYTQVIKLTCSA